MEQEYAKKEIAEHLLDRALTLFLDEKDYLSALHLAAAGEEILGNLLKSKGNKNALMDLSDATRAIGRILFGKDTPHRAVADRANHAKNLIKHLGSPYEKTVTFDAAEEAYDMLERGIQNYRLLNGSYTPRMERLSREFRPG